MQSTFTILQAISDSNFEILVAAYLRRTYPELRGLITTGVNEQGKSIPYPVDNILFIDGNPPKCISVASTTINRARLRGKWLGNKQDIGDLKKAVWEFSKWQERFEGIQCILYLAINQFLKSDVPLYQDVIKEGHNQGVAVRILEASPLIDFLDFDTDGQYIADALLGIKARRLSKNLLKEIAYKSLQAHEDRFALQNSVEIRRNAQKELANRLIQSIKPLFGLRGPSGSGKSTVLRQFGREVNISGGIAIWIPAEDLSPNLLLPTLLLNVFRRYQPSLDVSAGEDFVNLSTEFNSTILLLIDDINRVSNPELALATLNALGSSLNRMDLTVRIVAPLWPGQLAPSPDQQTKDKLWEFIELTTFSETERVEFAAHLEAIDIHASRAVVDALHGDPFLSGLAIQQTQRKATEDTVQLLRGIFEDTRKLAFVAAQQTLIQTTQDEYANALDALIAFILQHHEPEPLWQDVRQAVGNETARLLLTLVGTNRIGWIDDSTGKEIWRWKHNRLRDALIGQWLALYIHSHLRSAELSGELKAWLHDPGLAEAFALVFVFVPPPTERILDIVGQNQPLALVEVLRLNLFPSQSKLCKMIASYLHMFIANYDETSAYFVTTPQHTVLQKLTHINHPLVHMITESMEQSISVNFARFRNGDLHAGIYIIRRYANDFPTSINFPFLEEVIEHFAHTQERRRENIIQQLALSIEDRKSAVIALYFGSFMCWPESIEPFWSAWDQLQLQEKKFSVAAMVWFLSVHDTKAIVPKLKNAFLMSLELSGEEPEQGKAPERHTYFLNPLRLTLWRPMTQVAAITWTEIIIGAEQLKATTAQLLGGIDHPMPQEAYIRWQGKRNWMGYWDETAEPIDPLAEYPFRDLLPVLPESREHVWKIVIHDSDDDIRREALYMWRRSAQKSDLPRLQEITADDPLFDKVLAIRLKLRDIIAAPTLVHFIHDKPKEWCRYAPFLIDEPGVFNALLENLKGAIDSDVGWSYSYDLFKHLSQDHLGRLIDVHRALLLNQPRIWPSLWLSGRTNALQLVQAAIFQSSHEDLEHFFSPITDVPISQAMLDCLVPILDKFTTEELKWLGYSLVRQKKVSWLKEHLPHIVSNPEHRTFRWITIDGVISTLQEAANLVPAGWKTVDRKSELIALEISVDHESDYIVDIIDATKTWLEYSITPEKLIIAARIVSKYGEGAIIDWWVQQKPEDESVYKYWSDALYQLQLRRWNV